jgi:hypothetical protein
MHAPQPGEVAGAVAEPFWRVVGAAVRGVSHERLNLPCQDAQGCRVLPGGILLAVVADGAGTAAFSDQGAQAAVEETLRALETALDGGRPANPGEWEDLLASAFYSARQVVIDLAERAGESPREYACTLAGVVAGENGLVAGQIGDGAVVGRNLNDELFTVTRLQRGEYANETHFLIEEDALVTAEIEYIDRPVGALAVMSDGLIRLALKMPSQDPHVPFFQPLFRFATAEAGAEGAAEKLEAFLGSSRVNDRTDDDKSLVLAVLHSDGKPPAGANQE